MTQTDDTAEDGFHEIQLSGKQLFFLFMLSTVMLVVVFLCGVLVGRDVRADLAADATAETAAAEPGASVAAEAPSTPASTEPPAPVAEPKLSYHERLQQAAPKEELKAEPQAPPTAKPAPPPAPAPAVTPPADAAPNVPTTGRPGTWFLQVTALKNRAAAAGTVRTLIGKGYPAYLEGPPPGTPAIYRVRIGRYASRSDAEQVARRLQKEEQFTSDIRR